VRLGERGLVYAVVTRDGDSKLSDRCVHGEQAVEHAVHGHAAHSRQDGQATQAHDDKEGRHEVR